VNTEEKVPTNFLRIPAEKFFEEVSLCDYFFDRKGWIGKGFKDDKLLLLLVTDCPEHFLISSNSVYTYRNIDLSVSKNSDFFMLEDEQEVLLISHDSSKRFPETTIFIRKK
jgi:hypothetical protein